MSDKSLYQNLNIYRITALRNSEEHIPLMDNYFAKLQDLFKKAINVWVLEREEEKKLHITFSTIIVETFDSIQSTNFTEFLMPTLNLREPTILDQYIADLE